MKVEVTRVVSGTMVEEYLTAIEELCRVNVVADGNSIKFDIDDRKHERYATDYEVTLTINVVKVREKK